MLSCVQCIYIYYMTMRGAMRIPLVSYYAV